LDQGVGAAEVACRLEVPAGTVRSWAHRAAKAAPVGTSPLDSPRWAEEVEQLARATFAAAARALAEFGFRVGGESVPPMPRLDGVAVSADRLGLAPRLYALAQRGVAVIRDQPTLGVLDRRLPLALASGRFALA
jgi:hypothetical protein